MTRNTKANLQRKLALAPVATPPDGLAGRIKSEIPKQLGFSTESERTNSRKSAMFNLRIAASIVLLVSSLYLALHLLSRTESTTQPAATAERSALPVTRVADLPNTPPEPGSNRAPQRSDLPALPSTPPAGIAVPKPNPSIAEAKQTETVAISAGFSGFVKDDEAPAMKPQKLAVADAAPVAVAAAAPAGPPPPAAAVEQAAPMMYAEANAPRDRAVAKAAAPGREEPPVRNFVAIQERIARGETPRSFDLNAIIQHFAAPERPPADLRVELEASATPLDATKWLLRVSVDAPATTSTAIDLEFGDAIASHHPLAGSPAPNETALYEIEFKPNAKADQTIATVRAGKAERSIRVADLHPWNTASSRMKRASLAAAWTRTLQSRTQTEAIVAKAREAHIDDLADMAERAERNQ